MQILLLHLNLHILLRHCFLELLVLNCLLLHNLLLLCNLLLKTMYYFVLEAGVIIAVIQLYYQCLQLAFLLLYVN
jgi:hypothetical protein